jgi:hypothetical protein
MAKGRRTGGKPKGYKAPATIDKEAKRELVRQLVAAELEPMVKAQIAHAKGVHFMILRNPDGTVTRATNEKQVDAACAVGAQAFEIVTQTPNVQAFSDLLNRALDKAREQPQDLNISSTLNIVDVLRQRRARQLKSQS